MPNNYKPLDETYFQNTDAPVPAGLLKEVYDNLRQVDLNQRKYQALRAWNVGRTSIEVEDNDAFNGGTKVNPGVFIGYPLSDGVNRDISTRGFQLIPCDPRGTVVSIPFYKSSTSNQVQVSMTYSIANSPALCCVGYSVGLTGTEGQITDLPFSPVTALDTGIVSSFYQDGPYPDLRRVNPIDDVITWVNTDKEKILLLTTSGEIGLATFTIDIPFGNQGDSIIYLLFAPTWSTVLLDEDASDRTLTILQDTNGLFDYNAFTDLVKDNVVSYSALNDQLNVTGGKVPLGLKVYSTNNTFYHHVLFVTPGRDGGAWDTDEVCWVVYPDLNEDVILNPSLYRYDVHLANRTTIYGVNVRELFTPPVEG